MRIGGAARVSGWAAVVTAVVMLGGCGSGDGGGVVTVVEEVPAPLTLPNLNNTELPTTVPEASNTAAGARATLKPRNGAKDIGPNEPVTVTMFGATLNEVVLKADDGTEVTGKLNAQKNGWTAGERLEYNTKYTYSGTATDTKGQQVPITGSFTTVKPAKLMGVQFRIPNGDTVGIGAPVVITFLGQVANRAAVERALTVTTSQGDKLEGSWGWMQDEDFQNLGYKQSQVHWRPTKSSYPGETPFWPSGTKVTVQANLKGVNFGGGVWGKSDVTTKFSIRPDGRLVLADASTFRLVVLKNGVKVKDYAVSYGKESIPGRGTLSGIHIVMERKAEVSMCNPQFDYCNVTEKWAVRINNNGEFIHENMLAKAAFGKANVSHGCINMSDVDAPDFYQDSKFGDPVIVSNTGGPQMTEQNYMYDWIYSPDKWKELSALG